MNLNSYNVLFIKDFSVHIKLATLPSRASTVRHLLSPWQAAPNSCHPPCTPSSATSVKLRSGRTTFWTLRPLFGHRLRVFTFSLRSVRVDRLRFGFAKSVAVCGVREKELCVTRCACQSIPRDNATTTHLKKTCWRSRKGKKEVEEAVRGSRRRKRRGAKKGLWRWSKKFTDQIRRRKISCEDDEFRKSGKILSVGSGVWEGKKCFSAARFRGGFLWFFEFLSFFYVFRE